jgi:hypothetical protein
MADEIIWTKVLAKHIFKSCSKWASVYSTYTHLSICVCVHMYTFRSDWGYHGANKAVKHHRTTVWEKETPGHGFWGSLPSRSADSRRYCTDAEQSFLTTSPREANLLCFSVGFTLGMWMTWSRPDLQGTTNHLIPCKLAKWSWLARCRATYQI